MRAQGVASGDHQISVNTPLQGYRGTPFGAGKTITPSTPYTSPLPSLHPQARQYTSPYRAASKSGVLEDWQLLEGTSIPYQDNNRRTELHEAASRGHGAEVRRLLEQGAEVSRQDIYGRTALHLAAAGGHEAVVKLLTEGGADPSIRDIDECTALHLAKSGGHDAVVRWLLDGGTDISCQETSGQMLLQAVEVVVERLESKDISPSQDINKWEGVDFSHRDSKGTGSQFAESQERKEAVRLSRYRKARSISQAKNLRLKVQGNTGESTGQKSSLHLSSDIQEFGDDFMGEEEEEEKVDEDEEMIEWTEEDGGEDERWEVEEEGEGKTKWDEESSNDDNFYSLGQYPNWDVPKDIENCASAEKGKRKAGTPQGDPQNQNSPVKRTKKDDQDDEHDREGEERKASKTRTRKQTSDQSRPYACPYFKNNLQEYMGCAGWNNPRLHRVKEHCKRFHLKPLQCRGCGIFRAGDNGQMKEHFSVGCERAAVIIPVGLDIIAKGKSLEQRGLSWKQIYQILFPECLASEIPSPYWEEEIEAPETPIVNEGLFSPQAHPPIADEDQMQLLARYTNFLQSRLPYLSSEILPGLFREYLHQPGARGGSISTTHGSDTAYRPSVRSSIAQLSNAPGPSRNLEPLHVSSSRIQSLANGPSAGGDIQDGFEDSEYEASPHKDQDMNLDPLPWNLVDDFDIHAF